MTTKTIFAFYRLWVSFAAILSNGESVVKRAPTLFFSPVENFVCWILSLGQRAAEGWVFVHTFVPVGHFSFSDY